MLLVGIDLVEINRIGKSIKNPRFCSSILGPTEYLQLEMRGFPVQSVAASFCAKEAFSKAVGTGLGGFALSDVELLRDANGKPSLKLSGRALTLALLHKAEFAVSVTHTKEYAEVIVIGQGELADEGTEL
jgi:holo-[acyl-carrier protein] synthase